MFRRVESLRNYTQHLPIMSLANSFLWVIEGVTGINVKKRRKCFKWASLESIVVNDIKKLLCSIINLAAATPYFILVRRWR